MAEAREVRIIPESITVQALKREYGRLHPGLKSTAIVWVGDVELPGGTSRYVQVGSDRQVTAYLNVMSDKSRFSVDDLIRVQSDLEPDHILEDIVKPSIQRIRSAFTDGDLFIEGPYCLNWRPGEVPIIKQDRIGIWCTHYG